MFSAPPRRGTGSVIRVRRRRSRPAARDVARANLGAAAARVAANEAHNGFDDGLPRGGGRAGLTMTCCGARARCRALGRACDGAKAFARGPLGSAQAADTIMLNETHASPRARLRTWLWGVRVGVGCARPRAVVNGDARAAASQAAPTARDTRNTAGGMLLITGAVCASVRRGRPLFTLTKRGGRRRRGVGQGQ